MTSIFGTLTNICYIGAVILLFAGGIVFGCYIEARKREKKFDSVRGHRPDQVG